MLVVKFELWPHGDEKQARVIGLAMIANTGGDERVGNYDAALSHAGKFFNKDGIYRSGKVVGFPRDLSPYHLLARVLKACGINA